MIDSVHAVDNLSDQTGHAIWQKRISFILLHEKKASFIWLTVCRKYSETLTLNPIRCIKYTVWAKWPVPFVLYINVQQLCESSLW